jgi:hypothetical protein
MRLGDAELEDLLSEGQRYRQKGWVRAKKSEGDTEIVTPTGDRIALGAEEWLVKDGDRWYVESDEVFRELFKPLIFGQCRKMTVVDAVQIRDAAEISVGGLTLAAAEGDWLLRSATDSSQPPQILDAEAFNQQYKRFVPRRGFRRWLRDAVEAVERKGYVRASLVYPLLLACAFAAVFCWGFQAFGEHTTPKADSNIQRAWSTLLLFTGSYLSLHREWDPEPTKNISQVGIAALTLTLFTAGSLTLLSRRARDFVRVLRPRARLVVIGEATTAAALVKSSIEHRIKTILITDSRDSVAALATKPSIPIIAAGELQSVLTRPSTRRVIRHATHMVVATDDDATNISLHASIDTMREAQRNPRRGEQEGHLSRYKDLVVIHDPGYADALRPRVIAGRLPDREVTCPAENIAEHVLHLLVAVATGGGHTCKKIAVRVIDPASPEAMDGFSADLARTITVWVDRLSQMLRLVDGKMFRTPDGETVTEKVPNIDIGDDAVADADLAIEIVVGKASDVAVYTFMQQGGSTLRIVITEGELVTFADAMRNCGRSDGSRVVNGREWLAAGAPMAGHKRPRVLVVDGRHVGLDAGLVTDDEGTQWARTFDLTYALMYSDGGYSVTGWQPGAPMGESVREVLAESEEAARAQGVWRAETFEMMRNKALKRISDRYSSMSAVENMLRLLDERGYELVRCERDSQGAEVELTLQDVEYVAANEHEDWRTKRTWCARTSVLPGRRYQEYLVAKFSSSGANDYCFQALSELRDRKNVPDERLRFAAEYNRRIARETYPAIAAAFGYRIVRRIDSNCNDVVSASGCGDCAGCVTQAVESVPDENVRKRTVEQT